jgi:hypothetical protein
MFILIEIIIFFILTLCFFDANSKSGKKGIIYNIRLALLQSFIGIAFISYVLVEILSLFNGLNKVNVIVSWVLVLLVIYFINRTRPLKLLLLQIITYKWEITLEAKRLLFGVFVLIILPLCLLSIFIPPNNWDSMAYHLPRVEHWIQNGNIYPYNTNIVRQVLTSPLSEYMLVNIQLLSGTDSFFNVVQFASFLLILIIGTLVFKEFNVSYKGQLLLVFALMSLPMMIFQSTTTQTDLLASLFFLAFIYFALLTYKELDEFKFNIFYLIISLALGVLTKYHIAIFALPICLYLFYFIITKKKVKDIYFTILIGVLIFSVILLPLFVRNIYFFGSITGKEVFAENATIVNSTLSIKNMLSNDLKHVIDFVSLPVDFYNKMLFSINHSIHSLIGISENAAGNNWAGEPFIVNNHLTEDTAGSLIHAIWIAIPLFFIYKMKNKLKLSLLIFYCFIGLSLYSLFFRYTPFDIRLLLPIILLLIIISTFVIIKQVKSQTIINLFIAFLFLIALFPVYFNRAKPIIIDPIYLKRILVHSPKAETKIKNIFEKSRLDNYFTQNQVVQKNIDSLFKSIPTTYNRINLKTEFDSYEYLIWVYAKQKYDSFYIGNSDSLPYKSYSKNSKPNYYYKIIIQDQNKHWQTRFLP